MLGLDFAAVLEAHKKEYGRGRLVGLDCSEMYFGLQGGMLDAAVRVAMRAPWGKTVREVSLLVPRLGSYVRHRCGGSYLDMSSFFYREEFGKELGYAPPMEFTLRRLWNGLASCSGPGRHARGMKVFVAGAKFADSEASFLCGEAGMQCQFMYALEGVHGRGTTRRERGSDLSFTEYSDAGMLEVGDYGGGLVITVGDEDSLRVEFEGGRARLLGCCVNGEDLDEDDFVVRDIIRW